MIPALPDFAAGLIPESWITASIADIIPANITFRRARVHSVSYSDKIVKTDVGDMPFDYLILATGSGPTPPADALCKLQTHTITNIADARELKTAFEQHLQRSSKPSIVINGAGYTGIELAICMARRTRKENVDIDIHLVELRNVIMTFLPPQQQQRVLRSITRHGITLHTNTKIAAYENNTLVLSDGAKIETPLICRTEGTMAPLDNPDPTAEQIADGRFVVTPTLALQRYPYVLVAGDAAGFNTPHGFLRKAVNFAFYAGAHAGKNVARMIKKKPLRPFLPIDLGWVIPLGDDSVGKVFGNVPLCGKLGLRMHYAMCGYRNFSTQNFLRLLGHAVRAGAKYKHPDKG